jgi:hypothetical protein
MQHLTHRLLGLRRLAVHEAVSIQVLLGGEVFEAICALKGLETKVSHVIVSLPIKD